MRNYHDVRIFTALSGSDMNTDSLFYELFKLHPASLFELAGLEADGEYVFESITVKSTEKRMDGFFRRSGVLTARLRISSSKFRVMMIRQYIGDF